MHTQHQTIEESQSAPNNASAAASASLEHLPVVPDHQLHTAIGHQERFAAAAALALHRLVADARAAHHRQAARVHAVMRNALDACNVLDEILERRPVDGRQQRVQATDVRDLGAFAFGCREKGELVRRRYTHTHVPKH